MFVTFNTDTLNTYLRLSDVRAKHHLHYAQFIVENFIAGN